MCGIAGFCGERPLPRSLLAAMNATIRHRGPDDEGVWIAGPAARGGWANASGEVGLAQQRLSIIDLSPAGHGPMPNDDESLWITYNGEVYNFKEIRRELEAAGFRFRSQTDTEVVLKAYEKWGVDCLERLAGMFAFAIWDARARRLFLARDRLGKKPLYYAEYAGRFAFASELKALAADPDLPAEIDSEALALYLRWGYVPSPRSIFRAVRKLPPAHYAVWESGRLAVRRYWDPIAIALSAPYRGGDAEAEEQLESLLAEAVRGRMISDVPLGAFLSGGIDSSLVVALMQEQSARPVQSFTIRFENPEYNEADHAAAVARHLGTEHHEETCSGREMLDAIEKVPEIFDEPFADSSSVPTYLVSRMTRRHVTVALSGDGGDELFFGYPRYAAYDMTSWLLASPRVVRGATAMAVGLVPRRRFRRAASILRQSDPDLYARFVTYFRPDEVAELTGSPAADYPSYREGRRLLEPLPLSGRPPVLDLVTYLPEDILTKVDRASMAVSLETRNPLLDHRVVEFALRLPLKMKWRGRVSKWLLRRVLYRKVPRTLIDRPKMGFGVPLGDWFAGPLRGPMTDRLRSHRLEEMGLDPRIARRTWENFLAGSRDRLELLWSLWTLDSWAQTWRVESAAGPLALAGRGRDLRR
jgi:asparagine synthase (glutamine-hydrolysing)